MKKSFFFISFILLALCFLPALSLLYAHHDDVRFFDKLYTPASVNPDKRDPQYSVVYLIGRPLTAEINQAMYNNISNLNDLRILRWMTVAIFAICAGLLANILCSLGLSSLESLALSIAVFILPGIQYAVSMIAIQNALAVWLALWAYLVASRRGKKFSDTLVIFCLLLASMFLYPQWSFFIFVPALVKYLTAPDQDLSSALKEIGQLAVLFSLTVLFYYFYIKTFVSVNSSRAGSYAFTIDLNFLYWKFISVFSKILPMAFNFWNFHTNPWAGYALMGLTFVLLRKRAFVCFLLIFSTVCLWLLVRTDLILHRIFFVTSVLALISFLMGVRNKYIIIGAMTVALLGVYYLSLYNALNYHLEFAFIKQRLMAHHKPFSRIHIVLPKPNGKGYNGQATVDDAFNARTASYNFSTDTLNLLKAALQDAHVPNSWWVYSCENDQRECLGQMPKGYRLLVTHSQKDQPVYYSPGMVLIDFNDL